MIGRSSSNKRRPLAGEDGDANAGLLEEIESLSRALSLPHPSKPKATSSSSSLQKKPSFWNWKPLKALSHIGQRRFDCLFSLHVHSIENVPAAVGELALSVHWKRASDPPSSAASTSSVRARGGLAEFNETLTHRCSVYGARRNSDHSAAKYEARYFIICVSVANAVDLDFGKQLVDVTRLLPHTLEELEDAGSLSGKWNTSFRLSGRGKGASLNVSFGFSLIGDGSSESSNGRRLNMKTNDEGSIGKGGSKSRRWARSQSVEDVKVLHEVFPSSKSVASSLADSVEKMESSELCDFCEEDEVIKPKPRALIDHFEGHYLKELEEYGFATIEQDVDISPKDRLSTLIFKKIDPEVVDHGRQGLSKEVEESCDISGDFKESRLFHEKCQRDMEDKDLVFDVLPVSDEPVCWTSLHSETMTPDPIKYEEEERVQFANKYEADDTCNSIPGIDQSPFGLSSNGDPESPRERLWKQFEEETLGAGSLLFGPDIQTELDDEPCEEHNLSDGSEDFDLSHLIHEAERELHMENQGLSHNSSIKFVEDAETEALMRKWGLNENAFQCPPPASASINGFGSLIDLPSEITLKLSPLGEGLGPFVQTKDGGYLRSMSPSLFRNSKNGASLIMQVSSPVVVPVEIGSGVMEILHSLASVGIEKLSVQAKNLMPLEDLTGKTMKQILWEATSAVDACNMREDDGLISHKISSGRKEGILHFSSERDSEHVSVEDLAPLAMDKIEALCIEGLRIQSGMSDEEAPSNISPQFIGNTSSLEGKVSINDSFLGLQEIKGNADDVEGLMSLFITLEEWLRLDSGILDNEDQNNGRTSKILAAHHASSQNIITEGRKQERTDGRRSWGLLGSNFTAALMVQLRDPLRDYDPVGTPMLALVQVERVFLPPKTKIYTVSVNRNCEEEGDESELEIRTDPNKKEEGDVPQFKITNVHVAGLKTEPHKRRIWGNPIQQQSGSRWLLANGMGKSNKHPLMKSKASSVTTTVHTGDSLWSISSHFHGTGSKWKDISAVNPRVRNPDIKFPKETMSLC